LEEAFWGKDEEKPMMNCTRNSTFKQMKPLRNSTDKKNDDTIYVHCVLVF
jgi:hypothetical protein